MICLICDCRHPAGLDCPRCAAANAALGGKLPEIMAWLKGVIRIQAEYAADMRSLEQYRTKRQMGAGTTKGGNSK